MLTHKGIKARVGVLFGGRSGEHEISIRSAHFVAESIDPTKFDVTLVGIDRSGNWHLHSPESFSRTNTDASCDGARRVLAAPASGTCRLLDANAPQRTLAVLDVVFPTLHGPYGEDGSMQGFLETLGVPYVGAGVLGSAVGMDKDVQKRLLSHAGLPIVPYVALTRHAWMQQETHALDTLRSLDWPMFVKPAGLGSSVGISKARSKEELRRAIDLAFQLDPKVVVENGVDAREIECAVLGNDTPEASVPGEIVPEADFYSYEAKYAAESPARLLIPAPLSDDLTQLVRSQALRVYRVLGCSGMARVDFFLERASGRLYVNELNTIPGFTSISMFPKLWGASGVAAKDLTSALIQLALQRCETESSTAN